MTNKEFIQSCETKHLVALIVNVFEHKKPTVDKLCARLEKAKSTEKRIMVAVNWLNSQYVVGGEKENHA